MIYIDFTPPPNNPAPHCRNYRSCRGGGSKLALPGVPDIPVCKTGQTPKRHRCRNGSDTGGLYLTINNQTYLVKQ